MKHKRIVNIQTDNCVCKIFRRTQKKNFPQLGLWVLRCNVDDAPMFYRMTGKQFKTSFNHWVCVVTNEKQFLLTKLKYGI